MYYLSTYVVLFIAIKVSFNYSTFTVKEDDNTLQISMFLSEPSPCCLNVFVEFTNEFIDDKATGELCIVHIYAYIVNNYSTRYVNSEC